MASNISLNKVYPVSRDVEYQSRVQENQMEYPLWWSKKQIIESFQNCPEDTAWNIFICSFVLLSIVFLYLDFIPYYDIIDLSYNVVYAIHVLGIAYNLYVNRENIEITCCTIFAFFIDCTTYFHYFLTIPLYPNESKLTAYYLRVHRPIRYLWALNDFDFRSSIIGTTLKNCYIFLVLRVTWTIIWIFFQKDVGDYKDEALLRYDKNDLHDTMSDRNVSIFFAGLYLINKIFIPIGATRHPQSDFERVLALFITISGCLTMIGSAVASLSLAIGIYMRPEEAFRARYRLIMRDMKESNVPRSLSKKVLKFYKMYWHKMRAVSSTQLLPAFPPWLPSIVYTDIYFKATQKSRILCDLSYSFLCEVAKTMQTLHYIPGDVIIKRSTRKSSIIYITYGDVEMLTAEDDSTAVLRLSRGSVLSACAGCAPAGCGKAHVEVRAATFCTAHLLHARDLWRTALKYGKDNGQAAIILASFYEHFEKVKRHYYLKTPEQSLYKSSIREFKRNLMSLQESRDASGALLLARTDIMLDIAGCYIMRNRADASLMDESDDICLRAVFPCILQPRSVLLTVWNSFVCCVIVAVCFTHPYYIAYKRSVPIQFRFYDYVVTCIYLLDLFVYLSTGEKVEDGVPITLAQTASQQIRSHWFVLDTVATMPVFEFIHDGHFAGINKVLRLPKVFRMLKSLEDDWVYYSNFLRFFSYSLLLVMSCYFVAAMQQGFMCFCFGHCSVTNLTHPPFWAHMPPDDTTIKNTLTFGMYWAMSLITVTCHKETGAITDWNNVLYAMLVLELCVILHIFMDAVYSATIMVATALKEDYDASITDVTKFLIRNDVDPILRQRFVTYLQLGWYTDKGYRMTNKKSSIYFDLPPHVYQDIVNRQRSKYILCIPFMKYLSKEDLKTVSSKVNVFYTSPNEILLNTGDISNEIYVIKQGICEIIDPDTKQVFNEIGPRNHFGVLECVLRLPAYYTVRAATHVQMLSISRKYLLNAIEIPQIKDAIEFAKEQTEYSSLQVRRQPFLSYTPPALIPNVERFRLPRKHEHDHAFLQPFRKLGFLSVLRYIFPRFTIRPDSEYLMRAEWYRGCCAVLSALVIPGYPYLSVDSLPFYFTLVLLDCSAYFDILQRMLVGYYNEKGILVYHPATTADHYIRGAFLIDLFGCLPLEKLETVLKELYKNKYRVAVSRQYLMLNRLLQLYRLPAAVQGLDRYIRRDIVLVIKATPLFLVLLNVMTCTLVFYSVNIYTIGNQSTLLIEPRNDRGGSWVELFKDNFRFNIMENIWDLHLASFFWVTFEASTTGYNIINPSNYDIMKIMFIGMLVAALLTTYFCVRIISIRSNVNKPLAAFQQHMKDMSAFMHRENLSPDLRKDVRAYYAYNWDKMGGLEYRTVLKLCDQITLRTDAILDIYGSTFAMCPILGQCDKSLLRLIGRAVHSVHFLKHTVIVETDDVIKDIFFVDSGSVELTGGEPEAPTSVILTKGSIFGDLDGERSHRSAVSLVSLSKVHLLQINANTFFNIVSDFPDVVHLMKSYRQYNEKYIIGGMNKDPLKMTRDGTKDKRHSFSNLHVRIGRGFLKYIRVKNDYIQSYLIIVSLLSVVGDTYNAGFQDNNMLLVLVLYALDMAFCLKFLILYILPFVIKDDDVGSGLRTNVHGYSKLETKFDVMSCLPTELLCFVRPDNRGLMFSFLRLNRIFRVVTLYKGIYRHHERLGVNMTLMTVYTVSIWFSLFVHITSCCWYFIGYLEDRAKPKSSWIYKNDGSSWCDNRYLCSMYFVLMTFAQNGVGDVLPKNRSEVVFVTILQIMSAMVFLIYVGEFSNIFQHQSFRSYEFFCKYLELQEYLKNNRVSKNLVKLVNKYSLHVWRQSRGVQVPHFLKTAPNCLRLRLMSAAFIDHLTNSDVFQNCEPAFLRQLVGCLHLYTYNEGMFVVRQHEITDSMYFIHTGRVLESSEETNITKVYYLGNCFGVLQGLTLNLPYSHSYRTITKCQILTLNLNDWEYLLNHFPESRNSIIPPSSFDDPNRKNRKVTKEERKRKVNIVNSNNKPPSGKRASSTEPMVLRPTEDKFTDPGPSTTFGSGSLNLPLKDLNIESTSESDSKESDNIIDSDKTEQDVRPLKATTDLDSTSQIQMRSPTEDKLVQDEHSETNTGSNLRRTESTTTIQSKASEMLDIEEFSNESSQDIDSLLRLEEQHITADLIAKFKKSSKPSISELKMGDDIPKSVESGLIISKFDMKDVDDYILERQEEDGVPAPHQEETAPVSQHNTSQPLVTSQQGIPSEVQSTSRANRHFFHVHYKDDDEGKGAKNGTGEDRSKQDSSSEASRKDVVKGINIKDVADTHDEDVESVDILNTTKAAEHKDRKENKELEVKVEVEKMKKNEVKEEEEKNKEVEAKGEVDNTKEEEVMIELEKKKVEELKVEVETKRPEEVKEEIEKKKEEVTRELKKEVKGEVEITKEVVTKEEVEKTKEDDIKGGVEKPKEEEVKREVEQPKEEQLKGEIQKTKEEEVKGAVKKSKEEDIKGEVEGPKEEEVMREVKQPKEEEKREVEKPKEEEVKGEVEKPKEGELKGEVETKRPEEVKKEVEKKKKEVPGELEKEKEVEIKGEVEKTKEDDIKEGLEKPKEDDIKGMVKNPKEKEVKGVVEQPKVEEEKREIEKPKEEEVKGEVEKLKEGKLKVEGGKSKEEEVKGEIEETKEEEVKGEVEKVKEEELKGEAEKKKKKEEEGGKSKEE